jgi:hypothetical protein
MESRGDDHCIEVLRPPVGLEPVRFGHPLKPAQGERPRRCFVALLYCFHSGRVGPNGGIGRRKWLVVGVESVERSISPDVPLQVMDRKQPWL